MKTALLVPVTRPNNIERIKKSAKGFDTVIIYEDVDRQGVNASRNILFEMALEDKEITHIQYLDDDDLIAPDVVPYYLKSLENVDIVYYPVYLDAGKGTIDYQRKPKYSNDPILYALSTDICPTNWIASVSALKKIKRKYKKLWDEKLSWGYGISFWTRAIMCDLIIGYYSLPGYICFEDTDENQLSKRSGFTEDTINMLEKFEEWVKKNIPNYESLYAKIFKRLKLEEKRKIFFNKQ